MAFDIKLYMIRITNLIFILFIFFASIFVTACDSMKDAVSSTPTAKMIKTDTYSGIDPSFSRGWTDQEKSDFIKKNSKSDLDRFMFRELVLDFESYYTYAQLEDYLKTYDYRESKSSRAIIVVDYISGKTPPEIEKILGKPNKTKMLNITEGEDSKEVFFYYDNMVEIHYKDGLSYYIKVNMPPKHVIILNDYNYSEIKKNDRHSIVKVATSI